MDQFVSDLAYAILSYSKSRLVNLDENVFVQRSPSHFSTGTFYWAHVRTLFLPRFFIQSLIENQHEKLCVIDESVAFMGGIDLCFGRWDTPQHVLADEDEIMWKGTPS